MSSGCQNHQVSYQCNYIHILYIGTCLILTSCTPLPNYTIPCTPSGPIVFCDVVGTEEDEESKEEIKNSKKNEKEADKTVSVNSLLYMERFATLLPVSGVRQWMCHGIER